MQVSRHCVLWFCRQKIVGWLKKKKKKRARGGKNKSGRRGGNVKDRLEL